MVALLIALGVAVVLLLVVNRRLAWRQRATQIGAGTQAWAPGQAPPAAHAETSPTANVAVLTRYEIWMRRVRREQLGAWDENWKDLSSAGQYASWRQLAETRGGRADVPGYLTRGLLSEVLYAAGGVERELGQLRKALADAQHFDPEATAQPARSPVEQPIVGSYGAPPFVREASYSFVNLLSWARATAERTDRRYRSGSPERAGLLPALADGQLRDGVEAALRHLRAALRDSRFLAEYALHAGAVPGDGTRSAESLPDGHILARVPDPRADPVLTRAAFEFTQDRDMLTYATGLMDAIETFVDSVLDAFAANRPARAGSLPPWSQLRADRTEQQVVDDPASPE
jgi:hypothetical protein